MLARALQGDRADGVRPRFVVNPHSSLNYFVGDAFVGRRIALNPAGEAGTEVRFANVPLGHLA